MQKIKALLAITLLMITITGYSQTKSKEEMVKKIFTVIKNKDEAGFVKLFPDAATMKAFIIKLSNGDTSGMQYLDNMHDSTLQEEFRDDFQSALRKAERNGVDLSDAVFVSYIADSAKNDGEMFSPVTLSGTIFFNSRNKEYFLDFNEVIWFDDKGWYGVEIGKINEKSKWKAKSDDDEPELEETKIDIADSMVVKPPEPKPVQKAKPKQPASKTPVKSKTTTPVRKQ